MSVGHPKRFENVCFGKLAERLSADTLYDDRHQRVSGVGIEMLVAGFEVQRLLPGNEIEDVSFGDHIVFAPTGQLEQRPLIAKPAGMMNQMANGDPFAEVGHFGDVLAHIVIERELALIGKQYDGYRGEFLGYRRDMKDGRRRDWYAVFQIGHTITAFV